jgi:hypothetical protein
VHAMISPYSRSPRQTTNRIRLPTNLIPTGKRTSPPNRADPVHREGKGPGQRLRTGVCPVGNGLSLRCLLGARALSTPNPRSSRISAQAPQSFPRHVSLGGGWMLAPPPWRCSEPDEACRSG